MSNRFIEASEEATVKTKEVQGKWFPLLEKAIIKVLFDTKIRKHGGKLVLGRILRSNDLIRRLTDNITEEGCDYIMFLDQVAFTNIPDGDKIRLIRHELRHCKVLGTPEKPKYRLVPHDIEDFQVEIELNADNIGWAKDAVQLATDIYDQIEESRKEQGEEPEKKPEPTPPVVEQKKFLLRKKD